MALPSDAQERLAAARDRLQATRATRTAEDLTTGHGPMPADEAAAARARIDAARARLRDRPRRRGTGRSR